MPKKPPADAATYDDKEAEDRLIAALRGARIAGAKPMKDVPRKRGESKPHKPQAELKAGKAQPRRKARAAKTTD
jgi:hypothetical protein